MSFFEIKTVMDVKNLLRHFGAIIYTGDQLGDYEMMEDEIRELYLEKLIDQEQFRGAMTVLKRAKNTCRNEK